MRIASFQKLTLLDFPGRTATTIFTIGCNFRCGFCHNPELVLPEKFPDTISEEIFFEFLDRRKKLLDGVCITGGEPTLQKDLPDFLRKIRKKGFATKLDTNGSNPEMLEKLFRENLLDFVALDIKASPENYAKLVGIDIFPKVQASKSLISQSGIEFELRTTLIREIHDEAEFTKILEFVRGAPKYFLQNFQVQGGCLDSTFEKMHGFTSTELKKMAERARGFVGECGVRS